MQTWVFIANKTISRKNALFFFLPFVKGGFSILPSCKNLNMTIAPNQTLYISGINTKIKKQGMFEI